MPQSAPSRRTPRRRNARKQQSQYTAPAANGEVSKNLTCKGRDSLQKHRCTENEKRHQIKGKQVKLPHNKTVCNRKRQSNQEHSLFFNGEGGFAVFFSLIDPDCHTVKACLVRQLRVGFAKSVSTLH